MSTSKVLQQLSFAQITLSIMSRIILFTLTLRESVVELLGTFGVYILIIPKAIISLLLLSLVLISPILICGAGFIRIICCRELVASKYIHAFHLTIPYILLSIVFAPHYVIKSVNESKMAESTRAPVTKQDYTDLIVTIYILSHMIIAAYFTTYTVLIMAVIYLIIASVISAYKYLSNNQYYASIAVFCFFMDSWWQIILTMIILLSLEEYHLWLAVIVSTFNFTNSLRVGVESQRWADLYQSAMYQFVINDGDEGLDLNERYNKIYCCFHFAAYNHHQFHEFNSIKCVHLQYDFISLDLLQKMEALKKLAEHTVINRSNSNKVRKRCFYQLVWLLVFLFPVECLGATDSNQLLTPTCHYFYICWKTLVFLYYIKKATPFYNSNTLWMVLDASCVRNGYVVENAKRMYRNLAILPLVKQYFPLEIVTIIVCYVSEDLFEHKVTKSD